MIIKARYREYLGYTEIVKIPTSLTDSRFLKQNPTGGFYSVESLLYSQYNFWKLIDEDMPVSTENIEADTTRNIKKDIEIKQKEYTKNINSRLNQQAVSLGFVSIETAGKYTGFDNAFRANAESLLLWVADTWTVALQIQADVEAESRPMPSWEELEAELPNYLG